MDRYESLVEKVYADGGRKFLFLNVPPTSRSPKFINQGDGVVKKHAAWVDVFNNGLVSMVDGFKGKHSDVSFFPSLPLDAGRGFMLMDIGYDGFL